MYSELLDIDFIPPHDSQTLPVIIPRESLTPWPIKLPLELALGAEPTADILLRMGVTDEQYLGWVCMPAFKKALAESAKDVREQGLTFKILCQGIAQDFLQELDHKLHDPEIAFSQKLDAFKHVTKLAGLEPIPQKEAANQNQNLVNIQINL